MPLAQRQEKQKETGASSLNPGSGWPGIVVVELSRARARGVEKYVRGGGEGGA